MTFTIEEKGQERRKIQMQIRIEKSQDAERQSVKFSGRHAETYRRVHRPSEISRVCLPRKPHPINSNISFFSRVVYTYIIICWNVCLFVCLYVLSRWESEIRFAYLLACFLLQSIERESADCRRWLIPSTQPPCFE